MTLASMQTLIRGVYDFTLTAGYYRLSPAELDDIVQMVYGHGKIEGAYSMCAKPEAADELECLEKAEARDAN